MDTPENAPTLETSAINTAAPRVRKRRAAADDGAAARDAEQLGRASFPVTQSSGKIALSRMTPEGRAKLLASLDDPELRAALGLSADAAVDAVADALAYKMIYGAIGNALAGLAKASGYTSESADGLRFTQEEADQLAPLTAKLANKYFGSLTKYQDEMALALMLYTMMDAKRQQLVKRPSPTLVHRPDSPGQTLAEVPTTPVQ